MYSKCSVVFATTSTKCKGNFMESTIREYNSPRKQNLGVLSPTPGKYKMLTIAGLRSFLTVTSTSLYRS